VGRILFEKDFLEIFKVLGASDITMMATLNGIVNADAIANTLANEIRSIFSKF
jgi:hypothetical protein